MPRNSNAQSNLSYFISTTKISTVKPIEMTRSSSAYVGAAVGPLVTGEVVELKLDRVVEDDDEAEPCCPDELAPLLVVAIELLVEAGVYVWLLMLRT